MKTVKIFSLLTGPSRDAVFRTSPWAEGSSAWFEVLARTTLEEGEQSLLITAMDDCGVIRAAIPVAQDGAKQLRGLTSPYTTLFAPALPDLAWARFLGLQARSWVANTLSLDALDVSDPGAASFLEGLAKSGLMDARFEHFENWYENIHDFDDYWSHRPSRLRSTVRRKLASLSQAHRMDFRLAYNGPDLQNALSAYLRVYQSSWKPAEPHPAFITSMVSELGNQNTVRLGTLAIDGTVVAAQIWLLKHTRATIFKLAHCEEAKAFSPGTLLTHWILQKLCREEGISAVDFGRGKDSYKSDWFSQHRMRYGVIATNWRDWRGLAATLTRVVPTRASALIR